ncbi:MAG: hypothetical protein O4861_20725 [Trichodesmium sp. St16_bin4-tuft]|nr:hypothetical protein [Trichodesmium sp. MAG_R01]MDE5073880.1 hypothetical protein [Trichodesmium sp. St5_bin8]MDE5091637.1 hypothetical protein [Trichodesmium sp. St18_bin3_1_1]MDE5100625.1 hypothetical protein [Trichodesmium sp. St16_bin4-tuft]
MKVFVHGKHFIGVRVILRNLQKLLFDFWPISVTVSSLLRWVLSSSQAATIMDN